ncbi:MAG: restriction endonuclease subunit S [Polaromonas sp.]
MNATQLLTHFDRLAEAPNAVPRLRRFILDMAVRGKLVEQDAGDESAAELLKRLASSRKKVAKNNGVPATSAPSKLPNGWVSARFADVLSLEYGDSLPADKRSNSGEFPVYGSNGVVGSHDEAFVHEPCIVIGRKGSAGALNLCTFKGCCVTDVAYYCLPPVGLDLHFTFKMFHTIGLDTLGKGVKPGLSRAEAYELWVPIPPLAEQHRIVVKVDELMVLCDQLEAAQQERENRRDSLAAASLQRLNQPAADTTSEAQRKHARFHLHNLPRLTTRPEHIKAMRQAILNLAVRGRLVSQNSNDESAAVLLKKICQSRSELLQADYPNAQEAKAQLRKQSGQLLPEGLSTLPNGWAWATLIQCSLLVIDCHNKTAPYTSSGTPLIRTTNVRDGRLNLKEPKFVDDLTYERWSARCSPEPGDVLITREAPMGEVAIIPDGMKICLGQRMMLARLVSGTIDPRFLLSSLSDPALMERVQDKPIGATVQHLRVGGVETLLVPLPPLSEQHRIVAKVDELMALCDQLEAQLTTTQTDSRRLLEAVLEAALAPA